MIYCISINLYHSILIVICIIINFIWNIGLHVVSDSLLYFTFFSKFILLIRWRSLWNLNFITFLSILIKDRLLMYYLWRTHKQMNKNEVPFIAYIFHELTSLLIWRLNYAVLYSLFVEYKFELIFIDFWKCNFAKKGSG